MAAGVIVQSWYATYDLIKRTEYHLEQLIAIQNKKEEINRMREER